MMKIQFKLVCASKEFIGSHSWLFQGADLTSEIIGARCPNDVIRTLFIYIFFLVCKLNYDMGSLLVVQSSMGKLQASIVSPVS